MYVEDACPSGLLDCGFLHRSHQPKVLFHQTLRQLTQQKTHIHVSLYSTVGISDKTSSCMLVVLYCINHTKIYKITTLHMM